MLRFKVVFILCVMMTGSFAAWAEDLTLEASVNEPKIALNEALQLTLTVSGSKSNIDPINLPTIDGFTATYLGPSTAISITNGEYHSERSFRYQLLPIKTGHYQIPAIAATINNQSLATKPIEIDVVDIPQNTVQGNGAPANKPDQSLQDKIKLVISLPKQTAYLNERMQLSLKLYVTGVPLRNVGYPQLDSSTIDLGQSTYQQTQEMVNGVNYDVVNFKVPFYPKQLGDITIGPAQVAAQMLYQQAENDDIFQGFLRSYSARPVSVTSGNIMLHVDSLPTEGQPENFNSAIGQFDFQAQISPTQVHVGDPITLKMSLVGEGKLKNIPWPTVELDGLKKYDPKETVTEQGKTFEQVMIPTTEQIKEIPAVEFSYFDPMAKEYRTITRGPFAINVLPASKSEEFKAVGYNNLSTNIDLVKPVDSNWWGKRVEQLVQTIVKLVHQGIFWVGFIVVAIVGGGMWLWRSYRNRLRNDQAFYRRTQAYRMAMKHLVKLNDAIAINDGKAFYESLDKTLINFLADNWHLPAGSLSHADIINRIAATQLNDADKKILADLLHDAETARFAGATVTPDAMHTKAAQFKQILEQLKRVLK